MELYSTALIPEEILRNLSTSQANPYLLYYYFQKYMTNEEKPPILNIFINITFNSFESIQKVIERQDSLISQLKEDLSYKVIRFKAKLIRNAVPGIGIESAFETGISLHFLYGFPYFPSSSLKGITSEYARSFNGVEEKSSEFVEVFGSQKNSGGVIFFDALPIQRSSIFALDVITPHYQEYYGGRSYPADYLSPVPNVFLTVKKGIEFKFFLASKNKIALNNAFEWLKGALEKLGAGGKTTSGYGHFIKFFEE